MSQRKLIRPKLSDVRSKKKKMPPKQTRKPTPPEQTFAEIYYYLKQMHSRTNMVIVLQDGETLTGWIEWYDKYAIKLNRHSEPNLLIPKQNIKYMYKEDELRESDADKEINSSEESGEE